VDETVHLAAQAKGCGAIAASAFGAGFGGSVWALVRDADVPSFIEKWSADYAKAFPGPAGAPPSPSSVSRSRTRPVLALTARVLGAWGCRDGGVLSDGAWARCVRGLDEPSKLAVSARRRWRWRAMEQQVFITTPVSR